MEHDVQVSRRLTQAITRRRALQAALAASGLALVGCSSATSLGGDPAAEEFLARPAEDRWPELFYKASERIQETYRFAVANQDLLQWMPCFCGCGSWGHNSNADCYVQEVRDDGSVLLDPMSFT